MLRHFRYATNENPTPYKPSPPAGNVGTTDTNNNGPSSEASLSFSTPYKMYYNLVAVIMMVNFIMVYI